MKKHSRFRSFAPFDDAFAEGDEDDVGSGEGSPTSSKRSVASSRIRRQRKKTFVDTAPQHRTAMGEYIVRKGEKPLTRLALADPSPADYDVDSKPTQHTYPEWSMNGRNFFTGSDGLKPAPNAYLLPDQMNWKRKKVPMSHKLKTPKKVIAGPCKAGAGGYMVKNYQVGKTGLKYSITKGRRGPVFTGPPNKIVEPCDTPGFATPGPNYEIVDNENNLPHPFHATFTHMPKEKSKDPWPAPQDYYPKTPGASSYPSWTMRPRCDRVEHSHGPGPAEYDLGTTVGDGLKYSLTARREPPIDDRTPGPTEYYREREYSHKESIQFHMQRPEPRPPRMPPPSKYNLRKEPKPWEGASLKGRCKTAWPAVLDSAFAECAYQRSPGPAAHSIIRQPYQSDSEALKGKTFGKPYTKLHQGRRPGPGDHGVIDAGILSTKPSAPAYSMGLKHFDYPPPANPGPAGYKAVPVDPGKAASLKFRLKPPKIRSKTPGPQRYSIPYGLYRVGPETKTGVALHSRQSPFVYSGFPTKQMYALAN